MANISISLESVNGNNVKLIFVNPGNWVTDSKDEKVKKKTKPKHRVKETVARNKNDQ